MTDPAPGLRAILTGLIDYAGLFPPASLSLEEALETYLRDLSGTDSWMLAGFVLPVSRMDDANRILDTMETSTPLSFSALGTGGADWVEYFENLEKDLDKISRFREQIHTRGRVNVYETRLPGPEFDFQIRSDAAIEKAAAGLAAQGLTPYFEIPFDANWETRSERAIRSIRLVSESFPVRFKIRTGGVVPEAFPTPRQLAWAILEAGGEQVAFKCTAGLHHPIRHFDPSIGARMHGFINVFTGIVLSGVHQLSLETLEAILTEEDPKQFTFTKTGLSWKELSATISEIEQVRGETGIAVGSCSFDDPRNDMKKLGWL